MRIYSGLEPCSGLEGDLEPRLKRDFGAHGIPSQARLPVLLLPASRDSLIMKDPARCVQISPCLDFCAHPEFISEDRSRPSRPRDLAGLFANVVQARQARSVASPPERERRGASRWTNVKRWPRLAAVAAVELRLEELFELRQQFLSTLGTFIFGPQRCDVELHRFR